MRSRLDHAQQLTVEFGSSHNREVLAKKSDLCGSISQSPDCQFGPAHMHTFLFDIFLCNEAFTLQPASGDLHWRTVTERTRRTFPVSIHANSRQRRESPLA
eukprot:scpid25901/ scgid23696/ 